MVGLMGAPARTNLGFGSGRRTQPATGLPAATGAMTAPANLGIGQPVNSQPAIGFSNPYLADQARAITDEATYALNTQMLPSITSGAQLAGGYGGSRQGIAEGLAIGNTQRSIGNALSNLYGTAYNADQDRANAWRIANLQADTSRYGADRSYDASIYGADRSYGASIYGSDISRANALTSADASMYGADRSAEATLGAAGIAANASMSNAATAAGASMYGADRSADSARYGYDISRANTLTNADVSRYATDTNAATSRYATDRNYEASLFSTAGNLGLGYDRLAMDASNTAFDNNIAAANLGLSIFDRMGTYDANAVDAMTGATNVPSSIVTGSTNVANAIAGNGGTTSSTATGASNPLMDGVAYGSIVNRLLRDLGLGG